MIPLIPSFLASKQRPNAKLIEFFFLFIILQFLHGFCSVHIVLFLNKMKLTMGSMLIWRVSCAIIWDNYGQEKTKMVDYPIRTSLFFICGKGGGVVFVSRLTWTCQTKQKVCLKGKNWFWCKMTQLCCGKCWG